MTKRYKYKSKQKALTKKVNKLMKSIEVKHHFTYLAVEAATDAVVEPLSMMAEQVTSHTRIGLRISPKKLSFRGFITYSSATGYIAGPVRLIVFQDREQRGVVPTLTELLEAPSTNSHLNHLNTKRFKILIDKTWSNTSMESGVTNNQHFIINRKLSGSIDYIGSSADQASQGKNTVYCVAIANNNLAGTNTTFTMNSLLEYTDA